MPELRNDLVTGRVVLLAPGRAARPHTVAPAVDHAAANTCPFCPGHEHETPPEVARTGSGAPDTPGWRVRVVPNLYPIVGGAGAPPGATGAHEVVILDPDHSRDLARLDDAAVAEVFGVLRDRARVHARAGLAHVQVLVNHGRAAGASIAHPHAQVLAIDFVPPAVADAARRARRAHTDVLAADAAASRSQGGLVHDPDPDAGDPPGLRGVVAWCPWAAASPYEIRITATDAGARFEDASVATVAGVARVTRDVVAGIGRVLGEVAYNVIVHNAPARGDDPYHWYVTVVPRVSTVAGFEYGTGVLVNTVVPADAAATLRAAIADVRAERREGGR